MEDKIGEEKRIKNYETFKKFLKTDMRIKESLLKDAPSELDGYSEESRIEYTDKLEHELKDFEDDLQIIADGFEFGDVVSEAIKKFFDQAKGKLAFGRYEPGVETEAYQKAFSQMRPDFVTEVKKRCIGYTMSEPERLASLMSKAVSVNEVLHVMHSYIMNNEQIMSSMPKLGEKIGMAKEPITLYGEETPLAKEIFDKFPDDLDVGITEIVATPENIFMMIRDRGHALTIAMDTSKEEEVDVKYFVPKICNDDMVRALKGIDKSSMQTGGAKGGFTTTKEGLAEEIFGFIDKVPTDADMPRPDWDQILAEIRAQNAAKKAAEEAARAAQEAQFNQTIQTNQPMQPAGEEKTFSSQDAEEVSKAPGRRMGRLQALQNKISQLLSPLLNRGKENKDQREDNSDERVD